MRKMRVQKKGVFAAIAVSMAAAACLLATDMLTENTMAAPLDGPTVVLSAANASGQPLTEPWDYVADYYYTTNVVIDPAGPGTNRYILVDAPAGIQQRRLWNIGQHKWRYLPHSYRKRGKRQPGLFGRVEDQRPHHQTERRRVLYRPCDRFGLRLTGQTKPNPKEPAA